MSRDELPPPKDDDAPDLLRGGMFYALMHRFGVDPADAARTARRAAGGALLLWLPGAVLAAIEGHLVPGKVGLPYLLDVAAYVRPLLVVPLFLVAKPILATAWRQAGARFRDRGIVGPEARPGAQALVERVTRAARHILPTLICLLLAAAASVKLVGIVEGGRRDAWYALPLAQGGSRLTLAGLWSGAVVHTAVFALTFGWIWRMFLWYRFLGGLSRLPLTLYATHPDRAAGLGFVGRTIAATAPLVLAWALSLASGAANRMLHHAEPLSSLLPLGVGLLVTVLLLLVLPPVVIFAPRIVRARRAALEDWGRRMAHAGEELRGAPPAAAGAADRGTEVSLEDLQIAVHAVRSTLPFPLDLSHLVPLLAALALPALALVLLVIPFGEVLEKLLSLLH